MHRGRIWWSSLKDWYIRAGLAISAWILSIVFARVYLIYSYKLMINRSYTRANLVVLCTQKLVQHHNRVPTAFNAAKTHNLPPTYRAETLSAAYSVLLVQRPVVCVLKYIYTSFRFHGLLLRSGSQQFLAHHPLDAVVRNLLTSLYSCPTPTLMTWCCVLFLSPPPFLGVRVGGWCCDPCVKGIRTQGNLYSFYPRATFWHGNQVPHLGTHKYQHITI